MLNFRRLVENRDSRLALALQGNCFRHPVAIGWGLRDFLVNSSIYVEPEKVSAGFWHMEISRKVNAEAEQHIPKSTVGI